MKMKFVNCLTCPGPPWIGNIKEKCSRCGSELTQVVNIIKNKNGKKKYILEFELSQKVIK